MSGHNASSMGRYSSTYPATLEGEGRVAPRALVPPPLPLSARSAPAESMAPTAEVARSRAARGSGFRERLDNARPAVSANAANAANAAAPRTAAPAKQAVIAATVTPAPATIHVEEAASAARDAGLLFLDVVRSGFDKRGLAGWLVGAYRKATSYAPSALARRQSSRPVPISIETLTPLPLVTKTGRARPGTPLAQAAPSTKPATTIRAEALESVVYRARVQALAALEGASHSHSRPAFVQEALARGHVVSVDVGGVIGFFPRDLPGMHLRDRVLSLFAADSLARPAAYSAELLVCPWCESVRFDAEVRSRGMCADHDRPSGVVGRREREAEAKASSSQSRRDDAYERAVRAVLEDDDFADETDAALRIPMRALIAG